MRTCWQFHHGESSFSGAVGTETNLKGNVRKKNGESYVYTTLPRSQTSFSTILGDVVSISVLSWLFLFRQIPIFFHFLNKLTLLKLPLQSLH